MVQPLPDQLFLRNFFRNSIRFARISAEKEIENCVPCSFWLFCKIVGRVQNTQIPDKLFGEYISQFLQMYDDVRAHTNAILHIAMMPGNFLKACPFFFTKCFELK